MGWFIKFAGAFIKDNFSMDVPELYSLYAHLLERYVAVGNKVNSASLIGRVGKSGVTYSHLHSELYRGDLDLKNKTWRYYPIGWSKEMIIKNWLPVYILIEKFRAYNSPPTVLTKEQQMLKIINTPISDPDFRNKVRTIYGV